MKSLQDILSDPRVQALPASGIADELDRALRECGAAVVTSPPGTGKSTLLPLTILAGLPETSGKIVMLEPRRLAARQIACRAADLLDEAVGQTVGYRVRLESKVSGQTRIEVLTEGILARMLIEDPTLDGVDTVIFDEFHERSVNTDEALALVLEARRVLRPELRIVVMSATMDCDAICRHIGAKEIRGEGKMFPVELVRGPEATEMDAAEKVAEAVRKACREQSGSILAFLPGEADIRRCESLLAGIPDVYPLYGMLPFEQQKKAIAPSPAGRRKVVLATSIAETSLTIEGVRCVVDSGLCRRQVFDSRSGLSRLETVRISLDMATQRSGRAGRVEPGVCIRLWSAATEARMAAARVPEVLEADLAPLVLDLAAWGAAAPLDLPWLTPPPANSVREATALLQSLCALDQTGRITRPGRKMAALPCHPRIANMLLHADSPESRVLAADIAAVLDGRDPLATGGEIEPGADICDRIRILGRNRDNRGGVWARLEAVSAQYRHILGSMPAKDSNLRNSAFSGGVDPFEAGRLLSYAYPERVAHSMEGKVATYQLSGGGAASVDATDPLGSYEWIVAASLRTGSPGSTPGHIFLAAPVSPESLGHLVRERDNISWDSRRGAVTASHERNVGCLCIGSSQIHSGNRDKIVSCICEAARKEGLTMLDFNDDVANLQRRIAAAASWHPELGLPDLSTETLLSSAPEWLPPFVGNATTVAQLKKIDLCTAIWSRLDYNMQQAVERIAPSHIEVPTGSRIHLEYRAGAEMPVLRVRLQECFGLLDTPRVDGGRRPVLMELLSPGFKPVQLTSDLASFWSGTYFEVRKELRRRYPRHSWPEDPLAADPVRGVRRH